MSDPGRGLKGVNGEASDTIAPDNVIPVDRFERERIARLEAGGDGSGLTITGVAEVDDTDANMESGPASPQQPSLSENQQAAPAEMQDGVEPAAVRTAVNVPQAGAHAQSDFTEAGQIGDHDPSHGAYPGRTELDRVGLARPATATGGDDEPYVSLARGRGAAIAEDPLDLAEISNAEFIEAADAPRSTPPASASEMVTDADDAVGADNPALAAPSGEAIADGSGTISEDVPSIPVSLADVAAAPGATDAGLTGDSATAVAASDRAPETVPTPPATGPAPSADVGSERADLDGANRAGVSDEGSQDIPFRVVQAPAVPLPNDGSRPAAGALPASELSAALTGPRPARPGQGGDDELLDAIQTALNGATEDKSDLLYDLEPVTVSKGPASTSDGVVARPPRGLDISLPARPTPPEPDEVGAAGSGRAGIDFDAPVEPVTAPVDTTQDALHRATSELHRALRAPTLASEHAVTTGDNGSGAASGERPPLILQPDSDDDGKRSSNALVGLAGGVLLAGIVGAAAYFLATGDSGTDAPGTTSARGIDSAGADGAIRAGTSDLSGYGVGTPPPRPPVQLTVGDVTGPATSPVRLNVQIKNFTPGSGNFLRVNNLPNDVRLSAGVRTEGGAWLIPTDKAAEISLSAKNQAYRDLKLSALIVKSDFTTRLTDPKSFTVSLIGVRSSAAPTMSAPKPATTGDATIPGIDVSGDLPGVSTTTGEFESPAPDKARVAKAPPAEDAAAGGAADAAPKAADKPKPKVKTAALTPPAPAGPATPTAMISHGRSLLKKGEIEPARSWFKKAFDAGSAEAALAMAHSFHPKRLAEDGLAESSGNLDAARTWYKKWITKSIEQGSLAQDLDFDRMIQRMVDY